MFRCLGSLASLTIGLFAVVALVAPPRPCTAAPPAPNIIFVLCDDHRFDCLGSMGHPFLETPHLDRLVERGVMMRRAYVTTSLCSPSRASILTGLYAHNHGVIDNYHPVDPKLEFFPSTLQKLGYQTAFVGKWHMGDTDSPVDAFDHWVSFRGQGVYFPDGHGTTRRVPQADPTGLNINGRRVPQRGYITDELTRYSIDWLKQRNDDRPFFLYLSHKAVHADFVPADRHRGRYDDEPMPIEVPSVQQTIAGDKPMWVRNQRNSRHGVDFGYNLPNFQPDVYYRRYCESLLAVDESIGRLHQTLDELNVADNTIVIYMGDNGFQFGDHGLIDKRTAYEASARVPLIFAGPGIDGGRRDDTLVANIDIGPTIVDLASGGKTDPNAGTGDAPTVDGLSFAANLSRSGAPDSSRGGAPEIRRHLLYEYYWERNYPHTPTLHAVIGDRFKYIRCHGLWDANELYDLKNDPGEKNNLIFAPEHAERIRSMNQTLWELIQNSGGESVPLLEDRGPVFPARDPGAAPQAKFPDEYLIDPLR